MNGLRSWFARGFVAMLVCSPWLALAEEKPEQPADPKHPIARDILDVRKKVGPRWLDGTIFSQFSDKNDDAGIIERTIEKLAKSPRPATPVVEPQPESGPLDIDPLSFDPARRLHARDLARKLDMLAADFEDENLFDDADRLRGVARRLRLRARGVSDNVPTPLPPVSESQPSKAPQAEQPSKTARKGDSQRQ